MRSEPDRAATAASGRKGGDAGGPIPPMPAPPGAPEPQPAPPPPAPEPAPAPVPPAPPEPEHRQRNGGVTAGIVLVVIGVIFLAAQVLPGVAWWNLWPLIIIVGGLVQAFSPGKEGWTVYRMFDGFVTVAWGLLFLAITMGYVSWGVFGTLLSLWPVLLIALGFELLGKALGAGWLRILGSIAIIAGLGYGVAIASGGISDGLIFAVPSGETVSVSEPVNGATEGSFEFEAGVARISMDGGDDLVSIEGRSPWGQPELDVERDGTTAAVTAALGGSDSTVLYPGSPAAEVDVRLSEDVVWDADLSTGVSALDADLSDVRIRSLVLKPGVAECDIKLGDVPPGVAEANVEVRSGVSNVIVSVPAGSEMRVEANAGLVGVRVSDRADEVAGGTWETPGFQQAQDIGKPVWIISVKAGIGAVTIDTY